MWFFDRLLNMEGTAVNEAVLLDPETIEWLANQRDDGPTPPPIFGHTQQVNLMKMAIEVQTGKSMKRPVIPGLELRVKRKIIKTNKSVAAAQERNRKKKELLDGSNSCG